VRILFDQGTPVPIRPFLKGHVVRTAAQQQWDTLRNGDLISLRPHMQLIVEAVSACKPGSFLEIAAPIE
jgi:uncharacterized cupin superfamily protein